MHNTTLLLLTALADGEGDSGTLLARLRALGDAPPLATFYRRLKEGIDEGWVEVLDAAEVAGPGRPAAIYRLTEAGRSAARAEAKRWKAVSDRLLRGEG
jgi:DNA-binding PadR family transcriptional regulator